MTIEEQGDEQRRRGRRWTREYMKENKKYEGGEQEKRRESVSS